MSIPRLSPIEIVTLRRAHNLNQTDFGKIFNVGRRTVAAWEAGTWRAPADLMSVFTNGKIEQGAQQTKMSNKVRETLDSYRTMRRDGFTHLEILQLWHKGGYVLTDEEKLAILPEIDPNNGESK